jgi:raffinose/stachyose/melibiose transport system permease protein
VTLKSYIGKVTAQIGLVGWSVMVLIPFALIILLSFRGNADIFASGLGLSGRFVPGNYATAWNGAAGSGAMSTYFVNSAVVAAAALTVALTAGVTGAYFATHLSKRVQAIYLRAFVFATVIPIVMLIVPFYQQFNALNLVNDPIAVGVAYGALTIPTTVLVMFPFFADFPRDLLEAAALDGLGSWRAFLAIVLPLAKGAITAVGLLVLIFVWGETQLGVVLLQTTSAQTVPVGLLSFQGQFVSDYGALFAGLSLGTIPIMILYLIFNKQVTKGITLGGFGGR